LVPAARPLGAQIFLPFSLPRPAEGSAPTVKARFLPPLIVNGKLDTPSRVRNAARREAETQRGRVFVRISDSARERRIGLFDGANELGLATALEQVVVLARHDEHDKVVGMRTEHDAVDLLDLDAALQHVDPRLLLARNLVLVLVLLDGDNVHGMLGDQDHAALLARAAVILVRIVGEHDLFVVGAWLLFTDPPSTCEHKALLLVPQPQQLVQ